MNAYFPNTLHPECWLLTCADASQAQALDAELRGRGAPSAFAAWRLQHGLVRSVACDDLAAAVRQALDDGAPVVHVHAQLPAQQLADALAPAALAGGEERLVHRRRWQDADRDLWPVLDAELDRPDAWVEVAWRLDNGTRSPVLMAGGDAASAQAYREAFGAWRSERFKLGDSGTSPFADDEGRIKYLYRTVFTRSPTDEEIQLAKQFLSLAATADAKLPPWVQYCQALLATNELQFLD